MSESRSYARTRVAVAVGHSTSSLKESATATRRWTKEETLGRVADGPKFSHPSTAPSQLDELVRGYEQITGDLVRSTRKHNLVAACYRVHGDDFLPLVRETFERTGTAMNLLGELRALPPRHLGDIPGAKSASAWCGCREEILRPDVLYCDAHRPVFGSSPELRYDRRPSNPAAAQFFGAASAPSAAGAPRP